MAGLRILLGVGFLYFHSSKFLLVPKDAFSILNLTHVSLSMPVESFLVILASTKLVCYEYFQTICYVEEK
jgi:hypothetical protein